MAALACVTTAVSGAGYELADIGRMNCADVHAHLDKGIAAGDAQAAYTAAQMVVRRVCFKRDMAAYQALLRKAVDRGHPRATDDLAHATALGEGVEQDFAAAGALWRRTPLFAGSALDDYSLGVSAALARLTWRYSGQSTPANWAVEHRFRARLEFDPAAPDDRVLTFERLGGTPVGAADEAARASRTIERELDDAWKRARRKLPTVDAKRVSSGRHETTWILLIRASSDKSDPTEFDSMLPH